MSEIGNKDLAHIKCTCGTEMLAIQVYDDDEDDLMAYLSIFKYYRHYPMSFLDRIRHMWKILRHGEPYGDQLCFGMDELKDMRSAADAAINIIEGRQRKFEERKAQDGK